MALGPLVGLAFILFLPVAVPAVLIYAVARRLVLSIRGRRPLRPRLRTLGLTGRAGGGR